MAQNTDLDPQAVQGISHDTPAKNTTQIRFYHLGAHDRLEKILSTLLKKSLQRDWKSHILCQDEQACERLCEQLWSLETNHFIAMGTKADGFEHRQMVWISELSDNINNAHVCFTINHAYPKSWDQFNLYCVLFNGSDSNLLNQTRFLWKTLDDAGYMISYWQHNNQTWQQKASRNQP
ncbi:MAG: DNA polymerase III subunit chi [Pseudomonadota bacterium]